jgi:hypothetical protein
VSEIAQASHGGDVLPGVVASVLLAALVIWNPELAGALVREDSLVEWLQVMLAAVAFGFVVASSLRKFKAADVLFCALLFVMAGSEINLDQRMFGIPILDARFFHHRTIPLALKVFSCSLVVTSALTLAVYLLARWRELWAEIWWGVSARWLHLLVVGTVFIGIAEIWEHQLNHLLPLPRYFLEESFELVGTLYLALGMLRRLRATPRAASGGSR